MKKAIVHLLLKEPSFELTIFANYCLVLNLLFLSKVVESVVVVQLQAFLDAAAILDPFFPASALTIG